MDLYLPDEDDRRLLREMVQAFKRNPANLNRREELQPRQASEVYIAKAQSATGIPAMSKYAGTGTGTDSYDEPGSAVCDIYKISELDATPDIRQVSGLTARVYNLSQAAVGGDWMLVTKTKFGKWVAIPTSLNTIYGRLTEELGAWSGTTNIPATMSVWDVNESGEWEDTGETIEVYPPFELATGALPNEARVSAVNKNGFWVVEDFPKWFWAVLQETLYYDYIADVELRIGSDLHSTGTIFHCFAPPVMTPGFVGAEPPGTSSHNFIDAGTFVKVELGAFGIWWATAAPCE